MYNVKSEPVFKTEMAQQPGGGSQLPEVDLPAKVLNEHRIRNVEEAKIVLNAYRLDVSKAVEKIYKFELKFIGRIPPETEKDLSRGPRNDVANQARRQLLWEMFTQMITGNPSTFGDNLRNFVYDCGINFYSTTKLGMGMGESLTFNINRNTLPPAQNAYLGKRIEEITANLLYCEEIELSKLGQFGETRSRSAVQFLDILSNQEIIRRNGYYIFQSKMFEKASEIRLQNDPRILKEGMQKNVRIVGNALKDATPIIQIDPKKSAFFPEMLVAEFLSNFLSGREQDLGRKIFNQMRQATKQIKGLSVITTHLENPRTFTVNGLTDRSASEITFECEGRGRISVVDYIEGRYPVRIPHPDLPCVVEKMPSKSGIKESYYPIELVKIVAGQRVNFDQQTPVLVEQMIRNCQALPAQFTVLNQKQKNNAFIASANPFFKAHNVRVDSDIITASGQVLHPPAIIYEANGRDREQADQSGNMQWKLPQNRQFLHAAETPPTWVAAIFQNGVDGNACNDFIKTFIAAAKRRGMRAEPPKRYEMFPTTDEKAIREKFELYKKNDARYVMFFTRDKLDSVHHTMKLMEVEFGITTQHISKMTMDKALGNRGAFLVIDNLLLKFNLKLGGINHGLATSAAMGNANHFNHDVVKDEWLRDSRMFIGLDMSHAAPQPLFERQKGEKPTEPTIVSMAYTLGHPLKMRGTYWAQQPRETSILQTQLVTNLVSALQAYNNEVRKFPQHIMVFRGGVSEGEYQKVATLEFGAFEIAFKELGQKHREFQPPHVTIIVVQQQSNYRIVPARVDSRGKPREQNVRAGTVVDEGVMHPVFTEFLLVGHHTIQGTAHPSRCTVVVDTCNPRVSLEELEYVSYHLCYAHGIVCSPVSVPAPLMAAADLKKRGRNNWKVANFGDDRSSGGARFTGDGSEHFFINMTSELKPSIPTKFWA
ncbi:piwi domain-containing protein [Ditylenchus destructor]|uniref:Piwi domain-containing protein n=1 Tax=Ditylenchus destructor TaxID=166010 RepID=A0AAD4N907_9BILA|nr:piwi domain-containing protein [Ditylenchus destructor]